MAEKTHRAGAGDATGEVAGPYFDDLRRGDEVRAPALTITDGHAALHQAIIGDRLALALDAGLSARVVGGRLAHPALVCDVAIGQSTPITQRVIGNLFYRGLTLRRPVLIGDTLHTTTSVVALRQNSPRPGRAATGLAVLRVVTVDQAGRGVLDFHRCAMLPLRDPGGATGHADDLGRIPSELDPAALSAACEGWRLDAFRDAVGGQHYEALADGARWSIAGGDVVSCAPELARLTLNVAMAHHDRHATAAGERLVYGGHTIGIAAAQLTRALPNLVTIVAWDGCDHLGPVREGDTLYSDVELTGREPLPGGGGLARLRSRVRAAPAAGGDHTDVLDWRLVGLLA